MERKILFVELEHCHEGFLRNLHRAELAHPLFAFLLFFQQLFLSGDVAAVALGKDVLAECLARFAGDDFAADGCLNRHLEHLTRDVLLELFCHLAGTGIGAVGMDDKGEGVHHLAADHDVQLDQLGLLVAGKFIVKGGISFGAGFERIEKVVDNLVERQLVVQLYAVGVQILGILIGAAALLTQLHAGADVGGGMSIIITLPSVMFSL